MEIIRLTTRITDTYDLNSLENIVIGLSNNKKEAFNSLTELSKNVKTELNEIESILKKNPNGMYGEGQKIELGSYTIRNMPNYPDGSKSVWIDSANDNNTGGQFKAELLEKTIKSFFDKNL
jgi:regulator of replication initiation timing